MRTKEFLKAVAVFFGTLVVGFGITAISFGLFDSLTQNQMRILFGLDLLTLLAISGGVWHYFESKKQRERREKELKARHDKRVELRNAQYREVEIIVAKNRFAA